MLCKTPGGFFPWRVRCDHRTPLHHCEAHGPRRATVEAARRSAARVGFRQIRLEDLCPKHAK